MDLVADNLFKGRLIRDLTGVDNFSRKCMAINVDHSVKNYQVVSTMEGLRLFAGRRPRLIQIDNGSEIVYTALDKWAYEHGVPLDFSRPSKYTE
jgi:putative transposase